MANKQIFINRDKGHFLCHSCAKAFESELELKQHCQSNVHKGEWCDPCERLFATYSAYASHIKYSSAHIWKCHLCAFDDGDEASLIAHQRDNHDYCRACRNTFVDLQQHQVRYHHQCWICFSEFNSDKERAEHLLFHKLTTKNAQTKHDNHCQTCDQGFDTQAELTMHLANHLPKTKECYGCTRFFARDCDILQHLESGVCGSKVTTADINRFAFEYHENRVYTNFHRHRYPFKCPTCHTDAASVTELYYHIEGPACAQKFDGTIAKLVEHIAQRVFDFMVGSQWF